MKDIYLIEYLVKSGYSEEEVTSPQFNIDSLEDNLTAPINLSKVENIDELGVFLGVHTSFLVSQEDVDSGKVYELSKVLCDFELIGVEPDIKLDKLFASSP